MGHPVSIVSPDRGGSATDHLWLHFTRMSAYSDHPVPVIERGEGAYIWDIHGRRYLDALSGLFAVQVGHGRVELAEVAAAQARKLAFFPIWSYAHPTAIELADRLAAAAPGDLNKVFFSSGGGESVETRARQSPWSAAVLHGIRPISTRKRSPRAGCWATGQARSTGPAPLRWALSTPR
jgi:adenosylmethionine-8-amino-7-oxononanoate aminotransferase